MQKPQRKRRCAKDAAPLRNNRQQKDKKMKLIALGFATLATLTLGTTLSQPAAAAPAAAGVLAPLVDDQSLASGLVTPAYYYGNPYRYRRHRYYQGGYNNYYRPQYYGGYGGYGYQRSYGYGGY
jgi:hypothetical protein